MDFIIKILETENVTHDVRRYKCEKPAGYHFVPGQATEVSINKPAWKDEKRPFTFTSLPDAPYLEFTIKSYKDHDGVTNELYKLQKNDELIIGDSWGAIEYKGPGYFLAGGAGITPFIAILRKLAQDNKAQGNKLFFSNKTTNDIILKDELTTILGESAIYIITDEKTDQYYNGFIDEAYLKKNITDLDKHFYVCGPPAMVESISAILNKLGAKADSVVFEK
jgi:ferredoxin-NADP reductase